MVLSEILTRDCILVPMNAETLEEATGLLFQRLESARILEHGTGTRLTGEFLSGVRGEVVRVNEWMVLLAAQTSRIERLVGCLGSAPIPFDLGDLGQGGTASALLLLLTPRRVSPLKIQAIPALSRFFRNKENAQRLRAASTPGEIVAFPDFMELEVQDQLLVGDGLTPLKYRVYPETPLAEVVGLMVRQGIRAVPVVGDKLEFLGLITASDAIKVLMPERISGSKGSREVGTVPAREVMSRSVMCISEDQSLVEAANLIVNKGVSQVPVVRGGELVGFLTAETALQLLHEPWDLLEKREGSDKAPRAPGEGSKE
jgi:CBS domain-containing protein